jgi:hypothetical protein
MKRSKVQMAIITLALSALVVNGCGDENGSQNSSAGSGNSAGSAGSGGAAGSAGSGGAAGSGGTDGSAGSGGAAGSGGSDGSAASLAHPPESTKGFTKCGSTVDGPIWCQPGMSCDAGDYEPCSEGCLSNSYCPTGYSCKKPDKVGALKKFCLPKGTPKVSKGENAGFSWCGYKNGDVFTCSPGSYCDDPKSNRCVTGCQTFVNCGEGEYCDYESGHSFWEGGCVTGSDGSSGSGGSGSNNCQGGDQFCCTLNCQYYSCPDDVAFEKCSGGFGACIDACPPDDMMCEINCLENTGQPDPSACTRKPEFDC